HRSSVGDLGEECGHQLLTRRTGFPCLVAVGCVAHLAPDLEEERGTSQFRRRQVARIRGSRIQREHGRRLVLSAVEKALRFVERVCHCRTYASGDETHCQKRAHGFSTIQERCPPPAELER